MYKLRQKCTQVKSFHFSVSNPYDRTIAEGYLTGSALVLDESGLHVLLLYHRKVQSSLQAGGHAEAGESSGEAVALREATEETVLTCNIVLALEYTGEFPR